MLICAVKTFNITSLICFEGEKISTDFCQSDFCMRHANENNRGFGGRD